MPRSGSGTYTLPSGNPVVTGTTIESNWANTTLSDIATTLTDSLSRSGQGGMTAALRVADGTQGAPGVGFANETGSGFYRAGTGEVWAVVQGAQTLNLDANGVYVPADKTTTVDGAFVFNEAGADKDARFEGDTDANLLFTDASTDRVGVGTNTPAAKLDVNGTVAISGNVTLSGGTANGVVYLNGSKVVTTGSGLTFDGTNFATTGTASATKLIPTGGSATGNGLYLPAANTLGFSTNGTQAMTLDASGNLLVGGTSGSARLNVIKTATGYAVNTSFYNDSTNTAGYCAVTFGQAATGSATGVIGTGGSTATNAAFQNTFVVGAQSNHPLVFTTNDTERARITSGGYAKFSPSGAYSSGATTPAHSFDQSDAGYYSLYVYHTASATANAGINVTYPNRSPNGTGDNFLICSDSTTVRAAFRSNGGLANYSGNDANLSDRREKTNFAPAKSYLDTICAIPVQTFNYIDQSPDDPGLTLGVVAQDVQAVAPELVMESNWGTEDNPKMRLSIYQTDLQYALMKCIQEQQALITALTARVAALEAQP